MEFVACDAEHLSEKLPHGHYDLVYSFGVLHHTPHPDAALSEIRKLVKPGGTLKVMVYHRYSWKVLWAIATYGKCAFWRADEIIARHSEAQTGCPVTYSYSRRTARDWVERHGFTVEDIYVDHVFPYRIPDYVQYRYVRNWYFRIMPKSVFRAFERVFGWHLMITARAR
jgi:SAM-dependent methyltransferase